MACVVLYNWQRLQVPREVTQRLLQVGFDVQKPIGVKRTPGDPDKVECRQPPEPGDEILHELYMPAGIRLAAMEARITQLEEKATEPQHVPDAPPKA